MPSSVEPALARVLSPRRGAVVAPAAAMGQLSVAAMASGRDALILVADAPTLAANASTAPLDYVIIDAALGRDSTHAAIRAARDADALTLVLVVATDLEEWHAHLSAGADLVLPHPLRASDLDAAFGALARRARTLVEPLVGRVATPWRLRVAEGTLFSPTSVAVCLSPAETRLIEALAVQNGAPMSRGDLARAAGMLEDGKRNVDAAMYRMRKRIESATGTLAPVRSVHGQGYVIAVPLEVVRAS